MTTNLASALVAAQQGAQAVGKTSVNAFHKYKYASAEALIEEARGCLSAAGLALITMRWRVEDDTTGAGLRSSKIFVSYRLFHTSGETLDFDTETSVLPEKGRPQDKAESTALTYNLGYFLRGLLLLPREDESVAVDARDDRSREHRPAPRLAPAVQARPREDIEQVAAQFVARIQAAASFAELKAISSDIAQVQLGETHREALRAQYNTRRAELGTKGPVAA